MSTGLPTANPKEDAGAGSHAKEVYGKTLGAAIDAERRKLVVFTCFFWKIRLRRKEVLLVLS